MKITRLAVFVLSALLLSCGIPPSAQVAAHASGEGYGAFSTGGMRVASAASPEQGKAEAFWGGAHK